MIRALPLAQAAVSLVSNGVNLSPSRFSLRSDQKRTWLQAKLNRSDTSCEMTASFSTINEMSRSVPCP
jgi:hypothetical protein